MGGGEVDKGWVEKQINQNADLKNRHNQWMEDQIKASGVDFLAPQVTTTQNESNTNALAMPEFTKETAPLVAKLSEMYQKDLANPTGLPEGYLGSQIRGTNAAYEGARIAANNTAARRGLSAEQAVSIGEPIEAARAGKIADAANAMPLIAEKMKSDKMAAAQGFAEQGKGQRTQSHTSSFGTTTAPPNLAGYLAYLNMLAPYMAPIMVPGAGTDNTGAYVQGGSAIAAAAIAAL